MIDEALDVGKGANIVISLVHHFLENHSLGAINIHLNADNCCGQNKNNTFLQYFMWRVLTGKSKSVNYSFLPVGHTKFSPDWCFGLLKKKYRQSEVSSLQDIKTVVERLASVNVTQLVGNSADNIFIPVYDWTTYLTPFFRRFPNFKKYHHFAFSYSHQGYIKYKELSDSPASTFQLSTTVPQPDTFPSQICDRACEKGSYGYFINFEMFVCKV
jgi:hypothetical protein